MASPQIKWPGTLLRLVVVAAGIATAGRLGFDAIVRLRPSSGRAVWVNEFVAQYQPNNHARTLIGPNCASVLARARSLVGADISYDPSYVRLSFPQGDVPSNTGVCADAIIRSFRADGRDLQALLNEDMHTAFASYPGLWSMHSPDPNIDHRRVPNLMTWFVRHGTVLPLSTLASDYRPCDIVAWDLGNGVTHIGLVSDHIIHGEPAIIHHIGGHPTEEDVLFDWRIIGHFAF